MSFKNVPIQLDTQYEVHFWDGAGIITDKDGIVIFKIDLTVTSFKGTPHLAEVVKTMLELKMQELLEELQTNKTFMNINY